MDTATSPDVPERPLRRLAVLRSLDDPAPAETTGGAADEHARHPGAPLLEKELERLREQCRRQEHALRHLADAMLIVRNGAEALRAQNRELLMQLEHLRAQRAASPPPRRITGG